MIPLLGVFRILAIVIFGMLCHLLLIYHNLPSCIKDVSLKQVIIFVQLAQILDLPSTEDWMTRTVWRCDALRTNYNTIRPAGRGRQCFGSHLVCLVCAQFNLGWFAMEPDFSPFSLRCPLWLILEELWPALPSVTFFSKRTARAFSKTPVSGCA